MTPARSHELRKHILFSAKAVFVEVGFERASMDVIAERAGTTKRTLYAHFQNKEGLFAAVFDLVRELLLGRLKNPGEYAPDPVEALVLFCGRFQEILFWNNSIRMCRLSIAESERFPAGSVRFYDAIFESAETLAADFLKTHFGFADTESVTAAEHLFSRVLHPGFTRRLFGAIPTNDEWLDDEAMSPNFDIEPARKAVSAVLAAHTTQAALRHAVMSAETSDTR